VLRQTVYTDVNTYGNSCNPYTELKMKIMLVTYTFQKVVGKVGKGGGRGPDSIKVCDKRFLKNYTHKKYSER
jgi:hypothetical protein